MLFKKLNINRIKYVIGVGIPPIVLTDFFTKNKSILMLKGMKLDTIPKDPVKASGIFFNMPDKAVHIAYEWFSKKYENLLSENIEEVIITFLMHEYGLKSIEPETKVADLCRCVLLNLLSPEPNEKLVSFMQTPINSVGSTADVQKFDLTSSNSLEIASFVPRVLENNNTFKKDNLSGVDDAGLIGLMAVANFESFKAIKEEFINRAKENNISDEIYKQFIDLVESRFPKTPTLGVTTKKSEPLGAILDLDPTEYQIFGVVSRVIEASQTIFIRVLALIKDGVYYQPTTEQKIAIFPELGDLIWLSRGHKKVLSLNEFGIFSVSLDHKWAGKGSQFTVHELLVQVFPVMHCEHSIEDLPRIRYWMLSNEHHLVQTEAFVLLGNTTLIRPNFTSNKTLDFDKPFDAYSNPTIFSINGDYFSLSASSSGVGVDLSSSESFFRKLIKGGISEQANLSKEQVSKIIEKFVEIKNGQNAQKVEEVIDTLDELIAKEVVFTELITQLNSSTKVQQEIQKNIERVVAEKTSQADGLRAQIKQLEEKRLSMEKAKAKDEEALRKLKVGLANDIKSTFEKAVQDGKKVLSDAALFQAILGSAHPRDVNNVSANSGVNDSGYRFYSINTRASAKVVVEDEFRPLRFKSAQIKRLFDVLTDAYSLGLTPAFMGNASRIFADAFANVLSLDAIDDIALSPGASLIPELINEKNLLDPKKIFLIKNFDVAPISLYGSLLIDLCYRKFLSGTSYEGVNAIFTFEDSGLGLTYPPSLDSTFVVIDTDAIEFEDEQIDLDDLQEFIRDGGAVDESAKRALFNVIRSLKAFDGVEDSVRFSRLCGFLRNTYFGRYLVEEN